ELGGAEVAAALAGEPNGEAVLSIHVATDAEVEAAVQEAAKGGGGGGEGGARSWSKGPPPPRVAGPMRSSPTPTATSGRSSTTRCIGWVAMDDPRCPKPRATSNQLL